MKIIVRQRCMSDRWDVVCRYGFHETLLAVHLTRAAAEQYAATYREVAA